MQHLDPKRITEQKIDETLDANYWNNRYLNHTSRWDLGAVAPPLKAYFDTLSDKAMRILIPGGGNSYEAEYLHDLGFKNVFVIDLAATPLANLLKRVPSFPSEHTIHGDFFELKGTYDLIVEQTFFCALHPKLRTEYVEKMSSLLTAKGILAGLLFDASLNNDQPPFGGSKAEYVPLFSKKFTILTMERAKNSHATRMGRELFFQLQKHM